jgi:hypothetical protein
MEMNWTVQQSKKQKERITPMAAQFLADLSMAYELSYQLRMICPQLFNAETLDSKAEAADMNEYSTKNPGILVLYELNMIISPYYAEKKMVKLGDIGHPDCFPYPVHNRRTRANVKTMQASERQLDEIWEKYDAHLEKKLKPEVNALLQSVWPPRDELQRTSDWVAPEKPAKNTSQKPDTAEYVTPLIPEKESDSKTDLPSRKEKPKTRGPAEDQLAEHAEPAFQHDTTTPAAPRLTLSKKPYHTFSTLFFKPSADSQPGEVPWTDFVSAMSAISFMPEKLYGSVWRFTPKDGSVFDTEMPVNFHEPHPAVKLPFRIPRLYGRRLTRNYGIDGGSFDLG